MSTKYKISKEVPTESFIKRLHELAKLVRLPKNDPIRIFSMRIPAEHDHCLDLVMSGSAIRLTSLEKENEYRAKIINDRDGVIKEQRKKILKLEKIIEYGLGEKDLKDEH